jgi:hypothetical protein
MSAESTMKLQRYALLAVVVAAVIADSRGAARQREALTDGDRISRFEKQVEELRLALRIPEITLAA